MVKVTRPNILIPVGRSCRKNAHVQYESSNIYYLENVNLKKKVKCHSQKVKYQQKDLITGNIHVKYKSSSTRCSKVISKVKVFPKIWIKLQGQGHRFKNNGIHGKVLLQGIFMSNIKALALTV